MKTFLCGSFLALAGAPSSGCISVAGDKLPEYGPALARGGERRNPKTVALTTNWRADISGAASTSSEASGYFEKAALDAFERSGSFRGVSSGGEADAYVELDMLNTGRSSGALVLLCGFTFGLIPAWATDEYHLSVEVLDGKGRRLDEFVVEDEMTTYFQLFLLFGMPFASPGSVVHKVHENMLLNAAARVREAVGRRA
ncbi:MAG: hypothetical protein HY721_33210 [Planctomycetes bacterium]|nr:hypothetical protein [Planctomycetota bacterium]